MKRASGALVAATLSATTSIARADPSADVTTRAEALFEEGKELRGAGHNAAACADFEESRRLQEGIGVTLYLADCYEQLGYLGRARAEFRRAEALARARGDKRWEVAAQRARALEPADERASARSRRDPMPADPAASEPPPRDPAAAPSWAPGAHGETADPSSASHATRRWVGIGVAGAGLATVGVGLVFGAVALSKRSQSDSGPCGADDRCTPEGLALRQQAESAATASTVTVLSGAAVVAAGVTVYLTTPRDREQVTVTPTVGMGGAGLAIAGRF